VCRDGLVLVVSGVMLVELNRVRRGDVQLLVLFDRRFRVPQLILVTVTFISLDEYRGRDRLGPMWMAQEHLSSVP
jgi:hypothetical protein